jgi:hypothetical protein
VGKFKLDRLNAVGASGIGNVAIKGDIKPTRSAASKTFFGGTVPVAIDLPNDHLAGVAVRDFAPKGSIVAGSIQSVAFGSFTSAAGQVTPGSLAAPTDAAALLIGLTSIVKAGSVNGKQTESFRVPFSDLAGQQLAFFVDPSGKSFSAADITFTQEAYNNGSAPASEFAATRGAVTAFIGWSNLGTTGVQSILLDGDGGSFTVDHTRVANGKRGQAHGPQAESPVRKVQAGPRASPLFPRL